MNIIPRLFRVFPHVFYTVLSHINVVNNIRDRSQARRIIRVGQIIIRDFCVKPTAKSTAPRDSPSKCADGGNEEAL